MRFSDEGIANNEAETKKFTSHLESGLDVQIEYKVFKSSEDNPEEAVIFLAGLQMKPGDSILKDLSESYAEYSHMNTYTIQSHLENATGFDESVSVDLFYEEAKGIADFIREKGFKKILITGYSVGGVRGINLAHILQNDPEIAIDGLVLLSSPGLYEQEPGSIKTNLIKDSLFTPHRVVQKQSEYPDAFRRGLHGAQSLLKVIAKGSKIKREFEEMEAYNKNVEELIVPIVIVQGMDDQVVEADKIVPSEISPGEREDYLKSTLFKRSPHVKMVIAEKLGKHGLPVFRAESVANTSIGLLNRYSRQQEVERSLQ